MTYLRYLHVRQCDPIKSCLNDLEEVLQHKNLRLFEEISPTSVVKLDVNRTFQEEGVGTGDVLVVEKVYEDHSKFPFSDCIKWYSKMAKRREVTFVSRGGGGEKRRDFVEDLDEDLSFGETVGVIGKKVGREGGKGVVIWGGGGGGRCRGEVFSTLGQILGGGNRLYYSLEAVGEGKN